MVRRAAQSGSESERATGGLRTAGLAGEPEGQATGTVAGPEARGTEIDLAPGLAKNCAASYRKANPEVRKMWNQAFLRKVLVKQGQVAGHEYEEPFASLLGSHKPQIVEVRGFEPLTSAVRRQRSTPELHPRNQLQGSTAVAGPWAR